MKKNDTSKLTTMATPQAFFEVTAKKDVSSMKEGQTGLFVFHQMRFSHNIMVYGDFGDLAGKNPKTGQTEIIHKLGFYKHMTYKEILETFDFQLFDDSEFKRLFENFKPVSV